MISFYFKGEIIQNMSGLGLHYVNDKPQWDLTSNSNIYGLSVSVRIFAIYICKFTFVSKIKLQNDILY